MNPAVARVALVIGGVAAGAFLVGMVICVLLYGCAPPPLPPEPPYVETVSALARDR